jgi:hypothetical protein
MACNVFLYAVKIAVSRGEMRNTYSDGLQRHGSLQFVADCVRVLEKRQSRKMLVSKLRLHYRAQPVNAVWGNSRCLL